MLKGKLFETSDNEFFPAKRIGMPIDPQSLGKLLDRDWPVLVQWVGGARDGAEDAVQAAFIKLAAEDPTPANCVAWLFTVSKRLAINDQVSRTNRRRRETQAGKQNREPIDDAFTNFERMLQSRFLGPAPTNRDGLIYECGYNAGVSATKNKIQQTATRWRAVGLAASVLTCVSLSFHYVSFGVNPNGKLGMDKQVNRDRQQESDSIPKPNTVAWITRLARDRQADPQTSGILRASGTTLTLTKPEGMKLKPDPAPAGTQNTPLRPTDYPLFLQG